MRVLIVDVANVMGSRPDGWWRDRRGAATRLLTELGELRPTDGFRFDRIVAVVEGRARGAVAPVRVDVVSAPGSGDDTIVAIADQVASADGVPVVVTADRGLRDRVPAGSEVIGPRTLLDALATPERE